MSFEITGKLIKKFEVEAKTATFSTREFVIETDEKFPQFIKFQLAQERVSLVDNYSENEQIKVSFDLRGREWQGKYFTNLNAWKIENANSSDQAAPPPAENDIPFEITGDNDLPF